MDTDKSSLESFICQGQVADSQNSYSSQLESQWIPQCLYSLTEPLLSLVN